MAESKEIKRTYNIPLRLMFGKKPKHTRAKVAIRAIKDYLKKHMKSDNINLGKELNENVWKNGMKNPPHHIKVDTIKDSKGVVTAELFGHKYISNKKEEKKESFKDRLMEKVAGPEKTIVKKVKENDKKADNKKEAKETTKKEETKPAKTKEQPEAIKPEVTSESKKE